MLTRIGIINFFLDDAGGHCGYGEFGRDINNGEVSGVSWRLWNNGTGCGACYQVFNIVISITISSNKKKKYHQILL